jgi:ABC-type Zn uptake system ZnuABC Zn-binding protein ZnuA
MKNKRFVINKLAESMLKIELDKISLGDAFIKVSKEIENLESSFNKFNWHIQDPRNFIYEHVSNIKRDVDLRKEKLKEKIDQICAEMIQKMDKYQQECYKNIESLKLKEKN